MVSYLTWHHCLSPRQETVREGFPTRHGTIVFHHDRKLFAKGFLLGMAPLFFITIGNCLQRGFLLSMAPLSFTAAGNCSQRVSYSAWHHCVSSRQETVREGFPTRHGTIVFQHDRKLFAKGFLLGMAPLTFTAARNYLRIVSYPAWHHCLSPRQETVRERFPTRHGTIVFHHDRKLFAKFFLLSRMMMYHAHGHNKKTAKGSAFAVSLISYSPNTGGRGLSSEGIGGSGESLLSVSSFFGSSPGA